MGKLKEIYYKALNLEFNNQDNNKIEIRRLKIFNLALLIESIILLVNIVRHLLKSDFNSAISVAILLILLQLLLFTRCLSNKSKYVVLLIIGFLFVFTFNHFVESSKDVIQTYYVLFFVCAIFLKGKQFVLGLTVAVLLYYFSFFWLGLDHVFNFLGALPFIFLAIVIRVFISDAEQNEEVISKQVEALKEVDTLKTRLFSNISHEIRTPLTLILGANENLETAKAPKKYTDSIRNNSNRLLELINQILELAKAENKKRITEISKINFSPFITSQLASFSNLSEAKNIKFEYEIDSKIRMIYLDVDLVSKVIYNLLGNAFKFSASGDTVLFAADLINQDGLQLTITDTGRGITPEELPFIFNQYYYSNIGLEASSGIGLALVYELVTSVGGTIEVSSKKNEGSSFVVNIPVTIERLELLKVNYTLIQTSPDNSNSPLYNLEVVDAQKVMPEVEYDADKKVLLLVEDNYELRKYIKEVVENEYAIIEAEDGKTGLEKAIEFTPDIIISDVMMPILDGLQMLQELKKDIRTSHIPVLILTAKTSETDKLKGLEYEADDYLVKPFNQTELLLRLKNRISAQLKMQKQFQVFSIKNLKNHELLSIEDKFLQTIKQKIEMHLLEETFGPDELAKEIGLSKSQLLRKIKAVTNVPTSIYMRNIRLEFAKERLINYTATISEIAYETGFSSPNYFSKCFKEYTGQTPKEFQESL
ncbi:response regulator [Flavobacterium sp. CYK-4]|uniref:hybrid sensor histidine kinase/response regulator transcription factor n=1 Tax=Flavobacterium lotistagni TaxID=2709660 RepID=UPI00140BC04A|nr:response regulator [Flavobacterium lotistagni]NHM07318.1 response regulator [Flavobacterium lotistagni]